MAEKNKDSKEKKNSDGPTWIKTGLAIGREIVGNGDVQKMFLGTYSDGTVRSIPDAIDGEIYSPKQKGKAIKRNNKRNKKKNRAKFKL